MANLHQPIKLKILATGVAVGVDSLTVFWFYETRWLILSFIVHSSIS